jgi:hypothetical protein
MKINAYRYVSIDEGRGQKHRGSAATCSLCLASNNRYCHPADGVFDTNILLSHAICPSFLQKWLGYRARSRARIDYIIICAAPHPWTGLLPRKFKPQKLILRAFSDFSWKLPAIRKLSVASIVCEVNQERECMCISWCGHCMSFPTTRRDWQRWRWREVAAAKRCVYYWSSTLKKNQRQSSLRWASSCGLSTIGVGGLVATTILELQINGVPP